MNPTTYLAWIVPRGDWVETYPSTNGRIIVAIRLSYLYVLAMIACAVADSFVSAKFSITEQALAAFEVTGWFLGAMLAISAGQFIGKRATAKPEMQPTASETVTGEAVVPAKLGTAGQPGAVVVAPPPVAPIPAPVVPDKLPTYIVKPRTDPRDG